MEKVYQSLLVPQRVHDVVNPRLAVSAGEEPGWVSDAGHVMNEEDRSAVSARCQDVYSAWRMEIGIVLLNALPKDVHPAGFTAALLNYWGVGDPKLHTGLLALFLLEQRRLEVRVGYGAERILKAEMLKRLQEERMVPHLKEGALRPALEEMVSGISEAMEKDGPPHWRRATDRGLVKPNKHGFGGGQTPIKEFMPKKTGVFD